MGTFKLSAPPKYMTMKMGCLVPIQCREVLPGDTWQAHSQALIRLAPMVAPQFSTVTAKIHHWFVPNRLVWEDWEKFITGGEDGLDASVYPTISITESSGTSTLLDYLGVPPSVANPTTISALPVRACALIWNENYRDQDLQTKLVIDKTSGPDTTTSTALQNVCWDKDIFTTARDSAAKGPDVVIPVSGGPAPVLGIGSENGTFGNTSGTNTRESDGTTSTYANYRISSVGNADNQMRIEEGGGADGGTADYPWIRTDVDDVYTSIDDLRVGLALRRYEENRLRFGGRYPEYLSFLGVNYSDSRLQRPEYLGGGQEVLQFSEVVQTAPEDAEDSQGVGNFTGHGIGSLRSNKFKRYFEEHGHVISFLIVKPVSQYGDGLNKMWLRRTKEDYWQRELEHIGQEEIQNRELYAASSGGYDPAGRFGYQDRYEHYRTGAHEPSVAGEMRDALSFWHMTRLADLVSPLPFVLNSDFVSCVPTNRIYQATWEDQLWCRVDNSIIASRLVTDNAKPMTF